MPDVTGASGLFEEGTESVVDLVCVGPRDAVRAALDYDELEVLDESWQPLTGELQRQHPVLIAQRRGSTRPITVQEMSEGTRDQLYLALRLAALELQRASGVGLPVLLDDVLMTSDEERSAATLDALAEFSNGTQVVVFTHHKHVADLAAKNVMSDRLTLVQI